MAGYISWRISFAFPQSYLGSSTGNSLLRLVLSTLFTVFCVCVWIPGCLRIYITFVCLWLGSCVCLWSAPNLTFLINIYRGVIAFADVTTIKKGLWCSIHPSIGVAAKEYTYVFYGFTDQQAVRVNLHQHAATSLSASPTNTTSKQTHTNTPQQHTPQTLPLTAPTNTAHQYSPPILPPILPTNVSYHHSTHTSHPCSHTNIVPCPLTFCFNLQLGALMVCLPSYST